MPFKMVPNVLNISLDDAVKMEPRLQEEEKNNPKVRKLLSLSRSLEGLNRHASTHAAGVVISDVPLVERVPLCSPKEDIVTQFAMKDIETVGLTKFDFLGLKTLTVIKNALQFIKEGKRETIEIENLPLDDEKTYQLLMRGDTDGVFQLESSGMKDILVSMKPDCIEDVIALIALYRPGPMNMVPEFIARKQGRTKIVYEIPELEAILKETYGVILYQEQVMQIASAIGNYTMAEADMLRRVMSKKKAEEMEKEKPKFLTGAKIKKIEEQKARTIWDQMETFAQYGFNKSHSTAYAMISYQTAYLKAHYPAEFMAALLTSEKDNRDKIIKHIAGCKEMGIPVLPPDINESQRDFSVSGDQIRFGLSAVKNVGIGAIDTIIEARDRLGKFRSFDHFCEHVDLRKVNKRVIESLIKCGAFDAMDYKRRPLMSSYEEIIELAQRRHREKSSGQSSIFDQFDKGVDADLKITERTPLPNLPEWETKELLGYEKETLGFYITGHPLSRFKECLGMVVNTDALRIVEKKDKEEVSLAGVVSNIREVTTKRKDLMAYITVEDLKGSITVIFFSDVYRNVYDLLHGEEPILIKGVVDVGEENTKVIASEAMLLAQALEHPFQQVTFHFDTTRLADEDLELFRLALKKHPGKAESFLHLINNQSETVISLGRSILCEPSGHLREEIDRILGSGSTKFT